MVVVIGVGNGIGCVYVYEFVKWGVWVVVNDLGGLVEG